MKKLNKKESASMSELLGILSYSERDTCFQLEGGGCLDIVRVICSDFQAIRDIDLEYENLKLQQFYQSRQSTTSIGVTHRMGVGECL